MSKVTFLAGYFPKGTYRLWGTILEGPGLSIQLQRRIEAMQAIDEESKSSAVGKVAAGLVGGAIIGPVGVAGGLLAGGNRRTVMFDCLLRGNRRFRAVTDGATWRELLAISADDGPSDYERRRDRHEKLAEENAMRTGDEATLRRINAARAKRADYELSLNSDMGERYEPPTKLAAQDQEVPNAFVGFLALAVVLAIVIAWILH